MAHLCRMLAQTSRGSVQIDRSLALLMGPHAPAQVRRVLPPVLDHIKRGGTLTEALRMQRRHFPEDFIELVAAGERGGNLDVAFEFLAHDYELRLEFLRSIIRQMVYPFLLVLSAFYVIPFFRGLILSPLSTEEYFIQFVTKVIVSWLPVIVVFLTLRQLGVLEKLCYGVASRVWPWHGILHNIALVRFFRCMAMLLEAGLGVPQAIERSAATTVNPRVRASLAKAVPMVQQGASLTQALQATGMLPELAIEMVRTGEYAGRLEELLQKIAQYIQESTKHYVLMLQFSFIALIIPALLVLLILQMIAVQVMVVFMALRTMLGG
jgi:type II secretory pathway component PulF